MKLTKEFPSHILPVRTGVYLTTQVDPESKVVLHGTKSYSLFDAENGIWGCNYPTVDEAAAKPEFEFAWQHKIWQGLAQEAR